MLGDKALNYLLKNHTFESVLDVGCGKGDQSDAFLESGKSVYAVDLGNSEYYNSRKKRIR